MVFVSETLGSLGEDRNLEWNIEVKMVRVNVKKMKMIINGENAENATGDGKFPRDVCRNQGLF